MGRIIGRARFLAFTPRAYTHAHARAHNTITPSLSHTHRPARALACTYVPSPARAGPGARPAGGRGTCPVKKSTTLYVLLILCAASTACTLILRDSDNYPRTTRVLHARSHALELRLLPPQDYSSTKPAISYIFCNSDSASCPSTTRALPLAQLLLFCPVV